MEGKVPRAHRNQNETLPTVHALDQCYFFLNVHITLIHLLIPPFLCFYNCILGTNRCQVLCCKKWELERHLSHWLGPHRAFRSLGPFILISVFPPIKHWLFSFKLSWYYWHITFLHPKWIHVVWQWDRISEIIEVPNRLGPSHWSHRAYSSTWNVKS